MPYVLSTSTQGGGLCAAGDRIETDCMADRKGPQITMTYAFVLTFCHCYETPLLECYTNFCF